jgi:uncharacterized repeat protein (TIGR01451 family)
MTRPTPTPCRATTTTGIGTWCARAHKCKCRRIQGWWFYAAPEITITLSPAQANVLPGQTVEFTVRYRNTGTATGTDVRISVPLPDGMTLVGSNPTARLEGRQLVWIVPSVPVNDEGTLRFTVRVE